MFCSILFLSGCTNEKENIEKKEEMKEETNTSSGTVNTMIESKKSAVKDSLYGYVDTIDKYYGTMEIETTDKMFVVKALMYNK